MHDLDADVATHGRIARAIEIGLDEARQHFFVDRIIVEDAPRSPAGFVGQRIIAVVVIAPAVERDHSGDADEIERYRIIEIVRRHRRIGRIILAGQHEAAIVEALLAVRIIGADPNAADRAVQFLRRLQTQRLQLVLDLRRVDEAVLAIRHRAAAAVPALRIGNQEQVGIGIIERGVEDDAAIGAHLETQRGFACADAAAASGTQIDLEIFLGLLEVRITEVEFQRQLFIGFELRVPAAGDNRRIAMDDVVAHDRLGPRPGALGYQAVLDGETGQQRRIAPRQRELDAAQALDILELRPIAVEGRVELVVGLPFEHAHHAIALQLVRLNIGLGTADDESRVGTVGRFGVAPGVESLFGGRRLHARIADRPAERAVGILVDVRDIGAISLVRNVRVELAEIVEFDARAGRDRPLAIGEGANRPHVDRPAERLPDERRVGRLVDNRSVQQFRRILIELYPAVVARRHLFAAIEQRRREVRGQAADRHDVRAPVEPLRREAGKARKRFGDRKVRKLADVFGRDDLDDRGVLLLCLDRIVDGAANAGDDDRAVSSCVVGGGGITAVLRIDGRRQHGGQREPQSDRARPAAENGRHGHVLIPLAQTGGLAAHRSRGRSSPPGSSPTRGLSHLEPRN